MTSAKPNQLHAVCLDLDGTLVDSLPALKKVYYKILESYGIQGSEHEFQELLGPGLREIAAILKQRHKLPHSVEELLFKYMGLVAEVYADSVELKDGARELLLHLQDRSVKIALVTSAPKLMAQQILGANSLLTFFEQVVTGDQVRQSKPDPEIYRMAVNKMQVPAENAVAIEDSVAGVISARAAGLTAIGIESGASTADELLQAGASFSTRTLTEVLEILSGNTLFESLSI